MMLAIETMVRASVAHGKGEEGRVDVVGGKCLLTGAGKLGVPMYQLTNTDQLKCTESLYIPSGGEAVTRPPLSQRRRPPHCWQPQYIGEEYDWFPCIRDLAQA